MKRKRPAGPRIFPPEDAAPLPADVLAPPPAPIDVRKCVDCGASVTPPMKYRCEACLARKGGGK